MAIKRNMDIDVIVSWQHEIDRCNKLLEECRERKLGILKEACNAGYPLYMDYLEDYMKVLHEDIVCIEKMITNNMKFYDYLKKMEYHTEPIELLVPIDKLEFRRL